MDKIFEPYITTKHQSVGTGIGLYMTNQIITKHYNGTIKAKNVNYRYKEFDLKGAEFTITLPLS
jgi:signal transduction histidine kinase